MPVYEYRCTQCGHEFDARQSFTDAALTVCPECGGALRKKFGSIGVTFSGSGFYRTDSREQSKKSGDRDSVKPDSGTTPASTPSSAPASTPPSTSGGSGGSPSSTP